MRSTTAALGEPSTLRLCVKLRTIHHIKTSRMGLPKSISSRLRPGNLEPVRIETELVQDRGVDVGDVVPVLDRVEAKLVGGAVDDAALDAAAGHPDGEAVGVMIAAVGALGTRCAAELGGPDDDRVVEQAALFQIVQQAGDWLVDLRHSSWSGCAAEARVGVPRTGAPLRRGRPGRSGRRAPTMRRAARHCSPKGRVTSWSRP